MDTCTGSKDANIHLHFICVFLQRCAQDKSLDWHRSVQPPTMQSSPAPPVDGEVILPVEESTRKMTTSWPNPRIKIMFKAFLLWHMIWEDKKRLRRVWGLWALLANPLVEDVTTFTVSVNNKEDKLYQQWDKRDSESKSKVLRSWYNQTASGSAASSSK